MFRAKLIVLIAVTMVFAQLQCAAACAGNRCGPEFAKSQSVPPCHRHRDHSQDRSPASCGYQLTSPPATTLQVLEVRALVMVALDSVDKLANVAAIDVQANRHIESAAFSPPESPHKTSSVTSSVLRI